MTDLASFAALGEEHGFSYRLRIPRHIFSGRGGLLSADMNGVSLDYRDFREYQPGDDIRFIDWNAFGRTDRLIVKLYREEITPHLDLLLDGSASMSVAGYDKSGPAVCLAAFLFSAAANSGMSASLYLAGQGCERVDAGREPPRAWQIPAFSSGLSLPESLDIRAPAWKRRSVRIVISDLMFASDPPSLAGRITRGASYTLFIRLLSGEELNPSLSGRIMLHDVESGERMDVMADRETVDLYLSALAAHGHEWSRALESFGAGLLTVSADDFENAPSPDGLLESGILERV